MEGIAPGRIGSNGPSVIDFDNDGFFDLFVAGYGRNFLYKNDGHGKFTDVAEQMGVMGGERATPSAWGDYDNDGRPDLYVSSYIDKPVNEKDYLYHNEGTRFVDVTPELFRKHGATHGLQWLDYNKDGAIDLAIANNNPDGRNALYRNLLPVEQARHSLQVPVLDSQGHYTRAGSEVRLYAAGTRRVVGGRIMDAGSGYTSQSQMSGALWSGRREESGRRGHVLHTSGTEDAPPAQRRSREGAQSHSDDQGALPGRPGGGEVNTEEVTCPLFLLPRFRWSTARDDEN